MDKTDNRFYREAGDCKCKRLGDWDGRHHPLCDGPDATIAEPVAVVGQDFQLLYCRQNWSEGLKVGMPLYTQPASQPKALTDEQILAVAWKYHYDEPDASGYDFGTRSLLEFARALLEAHK